MRFLPKSWKVPKFSRINYCSKARNTKLYKDSKNNFKKWTLSKIQRVSYNDDTSLDDIETVDYNNVPVRKLKTIKEDENDDIEVIKTVQRVVISDDDDDDDEDDDDD